MADSLLLRGALLGGGVVLGLAGAAAWALRGEERPPEAAPAPPAPAAAPAATSTPTSGTLAGLCEASSIVPWEGGWLVADNETEAGLHRFDARLAPAGLLPFGHTIEDAEALALTPDGGVLVVASQGANKNGKRKPLREQALQLGGAPVTPDLSGCAECGPARALPPKEGGLSVEGAAWWGGSPWLGVRSPLREGKALLLRMTGDGRTGLAVAEVVPVDLGGLGVRELVPDGDALWILAGPTGGGDGPHRLFRLTAPGAAPTVGLDALPAGSEGVWVEADGGVLVVTDGDGKPGEPCTAPATWRRLPGPVAR